MLSKFFLAALITYSTFVSQSLGGWATTTGKEDGLWDKHFLIVARVADVRVLDRKKEPEDAATHVLTLEPLFSLAGHFDPSERTEIQVRLMVYDYADSVHEAPPKGSTVLVFFALDVIASDEKRPFLCIPSDQCLFMPGNAALAVLHDRSDKRILETLTKVREARGVVGNTPGPSVGKKN